MCGIAGILSFQDLERKEVEVKCSEMVSVLRHRGPDDYGVDVVSDAPLCVLGQSRLAVIDLSAEGHQPMADRENGNVLIFNGEIYNYQELRKELSQAGHVFHTQSDTEVILKAYAQWKESALEHLNGMFAFALWDKRQQQLFVARDRLGIKPFYYTFENQVLIFSSEVRGVLRSELVDRKISLHGLRSYLAYGSVQEPWTLVDKVESLPAAHYATFKDGKIDLQSYWSPVREEVDLSPADVQAKIDDVVFHSVKRRMISDVPLGAFLSGGIDSAAIVAMMRKANVGDVKTFSVVFDDPAVDERKYAALAAEHLETHHAELELSGKMVKAELFNALDAFDSPSMDGLNTWFVSKITKEAGLTVALSGVGGDELFAGYDSFKKARAIERASRTLHKLPKWSGRAVSKHGASEKIRKFGEIIGFEYPPYFLSRQLLSGLQVESLLHEDVLTESSSWFPESYHDLSKASETWDPVNQISLLELSSYMRSTLLRDTDQMSMAHALEVRVPLLDHELVELLVGIPGEMKLDRHLQKPLLVKAAQGGIPDECIYRPKQGFSLPFDQWFANELKGDLEEFFHAASHSLFRPSSLSGLWQAYGAGQVSWSRIWALLILDNYLKKHRLSL